MIVRTFDCCFASDLPSKTSVAKTATVSVAMSSLAVSLLAMMSSFL